MIVEYRTVLAMVPNAKTTGSDTPDTFRPQCILLVDDHPIYHERVARTLVELGDMDIAGQAADGGLAVTMARDLAPDLVLLDISMPRGCGIAALAAIRQQDKPPLVVMLTASEDDLMQALRLGAQGYVLKRVGAEEQVSILRDVAGGRSHVAPGLASRILANLRAHRDGTPAAPLAGLSKREEEGLQRVAQGMSNREVGLKLDLQEKTVKHYMTSILQKLHLRNRVEAAMLAREHLKG